MKIFCASLAFLVAVTGCGRQDLDTKALDGALRAGDFWSVEEVLRDAWQERAESEPTRRLYAQALLQHHWFDIGMGLDVRDSVIAYRIQIVGLVSDSASDAQVQQIWQTWCDQTMARRDSAKTLQRYRSFTEQWPDNSLAWHRRAVLEFQLGSWDEARRSFSRGIELDSTNASAQFNFGMALWKHGDTREALERWLVALKREPENMDFAHWVGRAALKLGK